MDFDFGRVRKLVAAVATAIASVVTVYTAAQVDGEVTSEEIGAIAGAAVVGALGAYAVWRVPNEPEV